MTPAERAAVAALLPKAQEARTAEGRTGTPTNSMSLNERLFVERLGRDVEHGRGDLTLSMLDASYLRTLARKHGAPIPGAAAAMSPAGDIGQQNPPGAVMRYDAARQAIAEAKTVDEVREWGDKAAAVREYARRARNRDMEIDAAEIRVRAQRRMGELLGEMKAAGLLTDGRTKKKTVTDQVPFPGRVTLEDLDTTKNESSISQKLAAIAPDAFERLAARVRARMEADTALHAFDVLKERDGPINGARSVMAGRQEPDDSLDYFPTPPWATRALLRHVLPEIGVDPETIASAWDPACGEGHITGVLEEVTAGVVVGSDIYDYSADGRSPPGWRGTADFLAEDFGRAQVPHQPIDWIITNPPFEEKSLAFVLRAFEIAADGVAVFVQLRWLETVERYNKLFKQNPPTIIAFFAERVNLCKGKWDPDGSTATAYAWLVWKQGMEPRAPFWIPPDRRDQLARPDDRARYTAQPVLPVAHRPVPHDPDTGEITEPSATAVVRAFNASEPGGDHVNDRADDAAGTPKLESTPPAAAPLASDEEPAHPLDIPPLLRRTA